MEVRDFVFERFNSWPNCSCSSAGKRAGGFLFKQTTSASFRAFISLKITTLQMVIAEHEQTDGNGFEDFLGLIRYRVDFQRERVGLETCLTVGKLNGHGWDLSEFD